MIEELWRSQEELERRLRSSDYRNVLLVVEMAADPPEIRFDNISHTTGIETIEKVRTNPDRLDTPQIFDRSTKISA